MHHLGYSILHTLESYVAARLAFQVVDEGCQGSEVATAGQVRTVVVGLLV